MADSASTPKYPLSKAEHHCRKMATELHHMATSIDDEAIKDLLVASSIKMTTTADSIVVRSGGQL